MQKPTYNDLNTWLEHAIQERDRLSVKVETLQDDLEKTRKALDVAKERLKNTILDVEILATPEYLASRAKETLEEIAALEQKDK